MKKTGLIIMGLAVVMGIGSAAGVCAGTKKIIRFDEGKRVEIDVENGVAGATDAAGTEGADNTEIALENGTEDSAQEDTADSLELGKFWGPVMEKRDGGFSIDSKVPEGYQGEIVIHIDPDNTMILDSVTGFPADESQIAANQTVYVYTSPAMALSLPPQTTAELVLVNIPQDKGAPLYVNASGALEADGAGGYVLKTNGGEEIKVPANCPITPHLTRQMVYLESIEKGSKCLVWLDASGLAEKIVLFNK